MNQNTGGEELKLLNDFECKIHKGDEKARLKYLDPKNNGKILALAAKHGKIQIVNFLISHNFISDDEKKLAIDYAWQYKNYRSVLILLKSDAIFPKNFTIDKLNDENEDEKEIKNFVRERNCLHDYINNDNFEEIKRFVKRNASKFYLNEKNESACFAAVKNKKIQIYAYLKSIGAEFLNSGEARKFDTLELEHKATLKEIMPLYLPSIPERHIYNLISTCKANKPIEGLHVKLYDYFIKLDQIPEISVILQIVQHSDYLDIVFDFDEENVTRVNPMVSTNTRGEMNYVEGRLYIAASPKRGERKILATVAHELTHLAMQIVFQNDCKPYRGDKKNMEESFENIKCRIFKNVKNNHDSQFQSFLNVKYEYEEDDHHCELIVIVPQTLVEYEDGRKWLEDNASDLLDFYKKEVITKCEEFLKQSHILQVKNTTRSLNERSEEFLALQKFDTFFENVDFIKSFLNQEAKNIFILKTENTRLGMVRSLQGLFGKYFVHLNEQYLVSNLINFLAQLLEILNTFRTDVSTALLIRFNQDFSKDTLSQFFAAIPEVLETKPNKKFVFIINPNQEYEVRQALKEEELCGISAIEQDQHSTLHQLDAESKNKVLSKEIIFQGNTMVLSNLIGEDGDLHKLITGDTIESLVEGKEVSIGDEISDHSNLENKFVYINEEINKETLINEFKNSENIYIFKGLVGSNKKEQFINCFQEYFDKKIITREIISSQIQNIDFKHIETINKRLLVTEVFSDADIEKICQKNRQKKKYFIDIQNASKFILQKLYNPNIYIQRRFKIAEYHLLILESLISMNKNEIFILSKKNNLDELNLTEFHKNLRLVYTKEAEAIFKDLSLKKLTVHWFDANDFKDFCWVNSSGSVESLRPFYNYKNKSVDEKYVTEYLAYMKILIVADHPGTGKSSTLSNLCENLLILENHWVFRIHLKEKISGIKNTDFKHLDILKLVEILRKMNHNLEGKLTQSLLALAINPQKNFTKNLLLAFDGFDEILDEDDRFKIISLLKFLREKTKSKIWITTSLHYKKLLEDELSAFSIEFDSLFIKHKEMFIKNYFEDRSKLSFHPDLAKEIFDDVEEKNSKIQIYSAGLMSYLFEIENIFNKGISEFFYTPMQLKLLMENLADHFKFWTKNQDNLDFSYIGKNLLEFYEKFTDKRYEIYFERQNIDEEFAKKKEKESLEQYHKAIAVSLIKGKKSERFEIDKSFLLSVGLLHSFDDECDLDFIHPTMRDYYSALAFIDYIVNHSENSSDLKFLITDIFLKPEFSLIRKFMNSKSGTFDIKKIPQNNVIKFGKILTSLEGKNSFFMWFRRSKLDVITTQIFSIAVEENNENIRNILLLCNEVSAN